MIPPTPTTPQNAARAEGSAAATPAGTPSSEAVQRAGVACVKRLPAYLQMLRVLQGEGQEYVSGTVLATTHNLEPVIVRKDLAVTGIVGVPRRGFRVANGARRPEPYNLLPVDAGDFVGIPPLLRKSANLPGLWK